MSRGGLGARATLLIGLFSIASLACSTEVRLGRVGGPDAAVVEPDADPVIDAGELDAGLDAGITDEGPEPPPPPPPPLPADGRYYVTFVPGPTTLCAGSLAGIEPLFVDMLPTQVDLHDGTIEVVQIDERLEVWGEPIDRAFDLMTLTLTQTSTEGIFEGWTPRFGIGPGGSREDRAGFRMDIEVPPPLAPETKARLHYVDPSGDGECDIAFRALLTRQ